MNKFFLLPCVNQKSDNGYHGPVVVLACTTNNAFVLMFPVPQDYARQINYILNHPVEKLDMNVGGILGVYKTMLDAWKSGGRYLSGILMDVEHGSLIDQPVLAVHLIVSDEHGGVDSITKTNFVHAVMLSALERKEILVSDEILSKIRPEGEDMSKQTEIAEPDEINAALATQQASQDTLPAKLSDNNPFKQRKGKEKSKFPVDKQILNIAKKIMDGRLKN